MANTIQDARESLPADFPAGFSDEYDTAWQELTVADFTVGVLTTQALCLSEVESRLQRGTLSTTTVPTTTQINNWLKRAKLELSEVRGFTWKRRYAYTTTESGTYMYGLPPDYNGGYTALRDTTNKRPIRIWDRHLFDSKYPAPDELDYDEPTIACIKKMSVWLAPPPDGAYTLEIEYDTSGAETTADDYAWLPEIERWRCIDFATAEAFKVLHQWNASREYEAKWNYGLKKAIRADGKRKWRQIRFQAMSTFQEHAARNYQALEDDA